MGERLSEDVYSTAKAAVHRDRLREMRAGKVPYPVHVHWVLSDLCNLACPRCAYRMPGYVQNEMFADVVGNSNPARFFPSRAARTVLQDFRDMQVRGVQFTGGGEPTLHPEFRRIFELALAGPSAAILITNGLLLAKKDLVDLAVRCSGVRVSIDAATAETYAKVRPSLDQKSRFDTALSALSLLREARDRAKSACTIGAGFLIQAENWREIRDAAALFREAGADNIRIRTALTAEGANEHAAYIDDARALVALARNDCENGTFRVLGGEEGTDDPNTPPTEKTCHYQNLTTYLGADGNLYRCCAQSYGRRGWLGNVFTAGGLKALWDSDELRARIQEFDARGCIPCPFKQQNRVISALLANKDLDSRPVLAVPHSAFV